MAIMSWLKNSNICGGSVIDISIRELITSWDVYLQDDPVPGKASLPWSPHEIDFIGVGNQKFIITGHFCEGSSTNPAGSVLMQTSTLGSFCNVGSPSWFYSDKYVIAGTTSVQVLPKAPKMTINSKSQDEVDYNLTLIETKAW